MTRDHDLYANESPEQTYARHMEDWKQRGREDAEKGVFYAPYQTDEHGETGDPGDDDANHYYKLGFDERRGELGERFKWS